MKKTLLVLLLIPLIGWSQTIVETTPKKRNALLEMFTGVNCPYCPQGASIAASIYQANPDKVVLIAIHQGSFAAPSGSQPDFRTPFGNAIASLAGVTAYPAATVNRHFFPAYAYPAGSQNLAMMRNNYSTAANEIMQLPAYLNIGATAQIDALTREISVYVEVYYTDNSPNALNKLNVVLLQDKTYGPQAGGNAGNNYEHNNRLVHMITGQWGAEINETTIGSLYSNTFTYTIPEHYNNIPAELHNMRVAIYVTESNNKEVINGIQITPTFINVPTEPEFLILSHTTPSDIWEGTISPIFVVRSMCQELQSLNIRYKVNDNDYHYYTWEGSLPFAQSTTISLPEINFYPLLQNTLTVEITDTDNSPQNNSYTASFVKAAATTSENLTVSVKPDNYGSEITWKIRAQDGTIIAAGGPYSDNNTSIQNHSVTLSLGNYLLEVFDSYGDGNPGGYIRILSGNSTVIEINGSSYSTYGAKKFRIVEPVNMVLIPENGSTDVSGNGPFQIISDKALFTGTNLLITAATAPLSLRLKQNNASGQNIPYTVEVTDNREITIIPSETIPDNTVVYMAFLGKDEDGISISRNVTFTVNTPVGIQGSLENRLAIYPNPAKNRFYVSGIDSGIITVYNVDGRMIVQQPIESIETTVIIPEKTVGVVYVSIQTNQGIIVKPLILTE